MAKKHVHNTNWMIAMMWMLITKMKELEKYLQTQSMGTIEMHITEVFIARENM